MSEPKYRIGKACNPIEAFPKTTPEPPITDEMAERYTRDDEACRYDELVGIPRWVAGVLAEIAEMHTGCSGGEAREPGCPQCDAIWFAKEAYENG